MDPNALLARIRDLIADAAAQPEGSSSANESLWDAAEAFQDLDNWLAARHGFLPEAWKDARR